MSVTPIPSSELQTFIHPTAFVEPSATIAEGAKIGAFCYVGHNVSIGKGTELKAHAVIEENTSIGEYCQIHSYSVIGGAPQSVHYNGEPTTVRIGNHNIIREFVTINRGTAQDRGETVVGDHCFIMATCHIAHDCVVGNYVRFANGVTIGGHVQIDDYAILSGLSAAHQFVRIGKYAMLGAGVYIKHDIIPYGIVSRPEDHISGINIIGLKRNGFTDKEILHIRKAYNALFDKSEKLFAERIEDVKNNFGSDEVIKLILSFIEDDRKRPISQPND